MRRWESRSDELRRYVICANTRNTTSFATRISHNTISAAAVVACFGIHDFVYTLITSDLVGMSTTGQEIAWFGWAILIAVVAVLRQINEKRKQAEDVEEAEAKERVSGSETGDNNMR